MEWEYEYEYKILAYFTRGWFRLLRWKLSQAFLSSDYTHSIARQVTIVSTFNVHDISITE